MTRAVRLELRGLPEALVAAEAVTVLVPDRPSREDLPSELIRLNDRLAEPLLTADGRPRTSTRVVVEATQMSARPLSATVDTVVVSATLPCDG